MTLMVLAFSACDKELSSETTSQGREKTERIYAEIEDNGTKASISSTDGKFSWTESVDRIAVHLSNNTFVTSDGASASASKASFDVTYDPLYQRDGVAVFPSSILDNDYLHPYYQHGSDGSVYVNLPSSYSLAQVSGDLAPCPMIADNTKSDWAFKQVCALLRITINSIPPSTDHLELNFGAVNVNGKFEIYLPSSLKNAYLADTKDYETGRGSITITDLGISTWTDGMTVSVPLPLGDYSNVTVTAYNSSNKALLSASKRLDYSPQKGHGKKITVSMTTFSVGTNKRVVIAKANLFGKSNDNSTTVPDDMSNWVFTFGDNPYTTNTTWDVTNRSYFQWRELLSTNPDNDSDGTIGTSKLFNIANDYDNGAVWRVPSLSELDYLFRSRNNTRWAMVLLPSSESFPSLGSSSGTPGLFVFPDNWDNALNGVNVIPNGGDRSTTTVTRDEYLKMINAGAVFIPLAGEYGNERFYDIGAGGFYWSTTQYDATCAYDAGFYTTPEVQRGRQGKQAYKSVRLVRDVE